MMGEREDRGYFDCKSCGQAVTPNQVVCDDCLEGFKEVCLEEGERKAFARMEAVLKTAAHTENGPQKAILYLGRGPVYQLLVFLRYEAGQEIFNHWLGVSLKEALAKAEEGG